MAEDVVRTDDRSTWREEHIAVFERRYPQGTTARLAFDLALYTAQQRADLRGMGPGHIGNGHIRVREYRTGKESMIPMHPRLVASLTLKRGNRTAFLLSDRGKPFASDESFGLWFARKCAEAGLKGFGLRGLRQASARRLAEIGVSAKRIEAVTGFSVDPQAEPKRGAGKQGNGQVAEAGMAQSVGLGVETEALPFPGEYDFPIQIRDDLIVRFSSLPMDLSRDEAEKICRVILALAAPAP